MNLLLIVVDEAHLCHSGGTIFVPAIAASGSSNNARPEATDGLHGHRYTRGAEGHSPATRSQAPKVPIPVKSAGWSGENRPPELALYSAEAQEWEPCSEESPSWA